MKVVSTTNWKNHLTKGKEYEVLSMWKYQIKGKEGSGIYGYQVVMDNGKVMWMLPEEGYVPLKIKKNIPWRKILRSMGYRRYISSHKVACWTNPTNGVRLVESILPSNNVVKYIKDMESYCEVLDNYYMEMESIWTEGETV